VIWSLAETGMGIMPGGGGVVRVTRMAGIAATVLDIVGPGTAFHPAQALAAGHFVRCSRPPNFRR
jgi:enoyl-CoA hydratase/carnithine racemase